jgi:hypothetical protein
MIRGSEVARTLRPLRRLAASVAASGVGRLMKHTPSCVTNTESKRMPCPCHSHTVTAHSGFQAERARQPDHLRVISVTSLIGSAQANTRPTISWDLTSQSYLQQGLDTGAGGGGVVADDHSLVVGRPGYRGTGA